MFDGAPDVAYADTLVLTREGQPSGLDAWRIGDVIFSVGSSLSARLVEAFAPVP